MTRAPKVTPCDKPAKRRTLIAFGRIRGDTHRIVTLLPTGGAPK